MRAFLLVLAVSALLSGCAADEPPALDAPAPTRGHEVVVDEYSTVVSQQVAVRTPAFTTPYGDAEDSGIYRATEAAVALLEAQPCAGVDGVPVNHLSVIAVNSGGQAIAQATAGDGGVLVGEIDVASWVGSLGLVWVAEGEPVGLANDCAVVVRVTQVVAGELPAGYSAFA